jgi:aspartyl-tRNA(Asn)/glutamyl-tRNA(Gln) amidotransferase subunit B
MRTKEEANDYRYFPDPDLLPVRITDQDIKAWTAELPELPDPKRIRFETQFGLSAYDANLLVSTKELADYYEATLAVSGSIEPKLAANWVTGDVLGALNREGLSLEDIPITPARLGGLLLRLGDGTLSGKLAKRVFTQMWDGDLEADAIIEAEGLMQVTDEKAIAAMIDAVLLEHPDQVDQYRAGAEKLLGFFVGRVMKRSTGKANPQQVNQLLRERLGT